ncbi:hypothetical protein PoB_006960700 [Plakobranchus ocellatus]|uniref:Secreted protein n=1 Tax=Plakobranchus ocellatus TaxID=259542 RepID=A0AAV4DGJ9_9GAST|nr:hypothetical protein PoB_006960700 [Plakobranchus ocellatus]
MYLLMFYCTSGMACTCKSRVSSRFYGCSFFETGNFKSFIRHNGCSAASVAVWFEMGNSSVRMLVLLGAMLFGALWKSTEANMLHSSRFQLLIRESKKVPLTL